MDPEPGLERDPELELELEPELEVEFKAELELEPEAELPLIVLLVTVRLTGTDPTPLARGFTRARELDGPTFFTGDAAYNEYEASKQRMSRN
jgi:hypothetical protein